MAQINPEIPLSYSAPPVKTPDQIQQENLVTQNAQQELANRRLQYQNAQNDLALKAKEQARQEKDTQALGQAWAESEGKPDLFQANALKYGASVPSVMTWTGAYHDMIKKQADAGKEVNAGRAERYSAVAQAMQALGDNPTQEQWSRFGNRQVELNNVTADEAKDFMTLPTDPSEVKKYVTNIRNSMDFGGHVATQAASHASLQKTQQEIDQNAQLFPGKLAEQGSKTLEEQAKADQAQMGMHSSKLYNSALEGEDSYNKALAEVPENYRNRFPQQHDEDTAEKVMFAGLSDQAKASYTTRKVQQQIAQDNAQWRQTMAKESADMRREMQAGRASESAFRDLGKLQRDEDGVLKVQGDLFSQLQKARDGEPFYAIENGKVSNYANALNPDTDQGKAALAKMQSEYNALIPRMKGIMKQKSDVISAHGGTMEKPLEEYYADIDKWSFPKKGAKAPPPSTPQPVSPGVQQAADEANATAKPTVPAAQPKMAPAAPPPGPHSEADWRAMAKAAGKDESATVEWARKNSLLK